MPVNWYSKTEVMLFHTAKSCSTRRLSVARLIISTEPGIGFRCENEDKNVKILVIENALGIGKNTRRVFNGSVGEKNNAFKLHIRT